MDLVFCVGVGSSAILPVALGVLALMEPNLLQAETFSAVLTTFRRRSALALYDADMLVQLCKQEYNAVRARAAELQEEERAAVHVATQRAFALACVPGRTEGSDASSSAMSTGSITNKIDAAKLYLMQGLDVGGIEPLNFSALTDRLSLATSCTSANHPLARAPASHCREVLGAAAPGSIWATASPSAAEAHAAGQREAWETIEAFASSDGTFDLRVRSLCSFA